MIRVLDMFGKLILGGGLALGLAGTLDGAIAKSSETVLHAFAGTKNGDGAYPDAGLVMDSAGNLYGTTRNGGTNGDGTVFELAPDGTETLLYSFCSQANCTDGNQPLAGLIIDSAGNLYGTTSEGGTGNCSGANPKGCGTVFKLDPATGTETVLYSFCSLSNCADGLEPVAGLIRDDAGNLYGTTNSGGSGAGCPLSSGDYTCGTVFKVDPANRTETVLYAFCSEANCADGENPAAGLIMDGAGNLYGTTSGGGTCAGCGAGTVFKIAPNGTQTVLYSFCSQASCADGSEPTAGLIMDGDGNLYGTTLFGGGIASCANGCGTVFKLAPNGTETVLYSFCSLANCTDGNQPLAGLVMDSAGDLYGTTRAGGRTATGNGTVFKLSPNGTENVVYAFCRAGGVRCADGRYPAAGLTIGSAGVFGTTYWGGSASWGTVFKIAVPTVTAIASSPNPSVIGHSVTFAATVSSNAGAPPNGETVTFKEGTQVVATGTLNGGVARFTTASLPAGSTSVTAVYGGDFLFAGSTAQDRQLVDKLTTTTTLASSLNPSVSGQAVKFTAIVSASGETPSDGETVTFKKGFTVLGTGTLNGGSASFTTSSLPVGTSTITAFYKGDATFAASKSVAVSQMVDP